MDEFLYRHAYKYAHDVEGLLMDDADAYAAWIVNTYAPEWGDDDFSHRQAMNTWREEVGL